MRYLHDAPVLDFEGRPLVIPASADGVASETTRASLLRLILSGYQPTQNLQLNVMTELPLLKRVVRGLAKPPDKDGYYAWEDADHAVVKRVVDSLAPFLVGKLTMIADDIAGWVTNMPTETPEQAKAKADAALVAEAAKATAAKQPAGA